MNKKAWVKPQLQTVKIPPNVKALLIVLLRDEQKPRKIKTFDPPGMGDHDQAEQKPADDNQA